MTLKNSRGLLLRELAAFSAMALGAFALLSLWTSHAADVPGNFFPPNPVAQNRGGMTGAHLAHGLSLWMGVLAPFILAGLLILAGGRVFLRREIRGFWYRVPAALAFLLCIATVESMVGQGGSGTEGILQGRLSGGVYGTHVASVLRPAFGGLPSLAFVTILGSVALAGTTGGVPSWVRRAASHMPSIKLPKRKVKEEEEKEEIQSSIVAEFRPAPRPVEVVEEAPEEPEEEEPAPVITSVEPEEEKKEEIAVPEPAKEGEHVLPPLSLLEHPEDTEGTPDALLLEQSRTLEQTLSSFKVEARVCEIQRGPTITMYELELAPGTKVNKIVSLSDDLAMALKGQGIRVVYPLPGKSTVGVEVPNATQEVVRLKELIESEAYKKKKISIPLFIGKNARGEPLVKDLARMPHLLIAGQTGSGKSVCLNSVILSLLFTRKPDEVRLILVDPKQVELMAYENLPNLLLPVVTDMKKAAGVLGWVVQEMERRYERMARVGVRHISAYNALSPEELEERLPAEMRQDGVDPRMPFIVVVVDELGDLMIVAQREVEESIIRLAQKSRAVGIHVVLATQRPSADVITGLIKSNLPSRIAFQVASRVDSRTILDRNGADKLTGAGDLLFLAPGSSNPVRCQGTYVSDSEIRRSVSTMRQEAGPGYPKEMEDWDPTEATQEEQIEHDELFDQAVQIILETGRGSASLLQRRLEIGYTRASRLIDLMESRGVVGPYKGSKAREILVTLEEWDAMRSGSDEAT